MGSVPLEMIDWKNIVKFFTNWICQLLKNRLFHTEAIPSANFLQLIGKTSLTYFCSNRTICRLSSSSTSGKFLQKTFCQLGRAWFFEFIYINTIKDNYYYMKGKRTFWTLHLTLMLSVMTVEYLIIFTQGGGITPYVGQFEPR